MKKIAEFLKRNKRKIVQTVVTLVASIIVMGTCEIALADEFYIYTVSDWDLGALLDENAVMPTTLPNECGNYSNYAVVYCSGGSYQSNPQAEGYYIVCSNEMLYLSTAYAYGSYHLGLSTSDSESVVYYSTDFENWVLKDSMYVQIGLASNPCDTERFYYYTTILEVSGEDILAKYNDGSGTYGTAIDSFANGETPEYDKGYYSDIDFSNLSVDGLIKSLNGLVELLGAFPKVIAALFLFMPTWLQAMFTVGVGIGVILFIWKIIT